MCVTLVTSVFVNAQEDGHHGLDYGFSLGCSFMTTNEQGESHNNGVPGATISIGKRFNSNFYLGGEVSGFVPSLTQIGKFSKGSYWYIPIMLDARAYIPNSGNLTPFTQLKAGFLFNTEYDNKGESNHLGFGLMQGLSIKLSDGFDLDLSGGYLHRFHVGGDDTGSKGFVVMNLGVRFHK